ncbi:MAG TPA: protein translocase subunit SecF [Crinalium sp.]|jgi:preprotein translocase subunit SecF
MKLHVIKQRSLWWTISLAIILSGIVAMVISWTQLGAPLRPSLDFVGGTRLQVERDCSNPDNCKEPISPAEVRDVLSQQGLANSSIQILGENRQGLSIRTSSLNPDERAKLQSALAAKLGNLNPQAVKIDSVGPTLGQQLFRSGMLALILSFAGIMVYLSFRFQLDFAVFAIVALFHDVLITVGIFSILGLVIGVEADSLFIVALLTIVGFSVNDTVVIYDRIRETIQQNPNRHINDIVDDAVNQTLARSINTTLTVLLTLLAIFLFGGETLKYFALALIIGFTMGAYSSIFIASTLLAWWRQRSGHPIPSDADFADEAIDSSATPDDA